MAFFEIRGGIPLRGSVTVSGAKNAANIALIAGIVRFILVILDSGKIMDAYLPKAVEEQAASKKEGR